MGGTELNLMENSSSPNKRRRSSRRRRRTGKKKCDSELSSFVLYFPTTRIEIFSSRFVVKRVVL